MKFVNLRISPLFILISVIMVALYSQNLHAENPPQSSKQSNNRQESKVFQMNYGEAVEGRILYEDEVHYRVLTKEGVEKVLFKNEVASVNRLTAEIPSPVKAQTASNTGGKVIQKKGASVLEKLALISEKRRTNVKKFEELSRTIEYHDGRPGFSTSDVQFGLKPLLFALPIWLFFVFIFPALVLKLAIKLVGGSATVWQGILFGIRVFFVILIVSVLAILFTVLLLSMFGKLAAIFIFLIPLITIFTYYLCLTNDFTLTATQGILVMILQVVFQSAIPLLIYLSISKMTPYESLLRSV